MPLRQHKIYVEYVHSPLRANCLVLQLYVSALTYPDYAITTFPSKTAEDILVHICVIPHVCLYKHDYVSPHDSVDYLAHPESTSQIQAPSANATVI